MKPYQHILICLPTTGQSIASGTAISVANVAKEIQSSGIKVDLHNIDSAEIVTARDMFANMVLHSKTIDGLLFIDSDIAFECRVVQRMISLGEDLVAASYVRRTLHLPSLIAQAKGDSSLARATAHASSFTVIPSWDTASRGENRAGFTSMAAVGMGCALISRSALIAMIDRKVVRQRTDLNAGEGKTCWSFFEPLEHCGTRLGEDYSFCHRWTWQLKKKLWVCVDEVISHIGPYHFGARYADL